MNSLEETKLEIKLAINGQYQYWYIGITNDFQFIKKQKVYPRCLQYWELDLIEEAKEIDVFYQKKGCLSCSLTMINTPRNDKVFVYIY